MFEYCGGHDGTDDNRKRVQKWDIQGVRPDRQGDLQPSRIGKAISSPRRIELIDLLCQGPRTVEALSKQAGQSIANTSQHLQVLRSANLVESEQNGHFVTYRIADEKVANFFRSMRELAADRLSGIERARKEYLQNRGVSETIDAEEALLRVRRGSALLLDVRPSEEYHAGHIPGARSLPFAEFRRKLKELPKNKEIITYCRGPYCATAVDAVRLLKRRGYNATLLEEGILEWRSRGNRLTEKE